MKILAVTDVLSLKITIKQKKNGFVMDYNDQERLLALAVGD